MRDSINQILTIVNGIIWHNVVILVLLAVGILFTIWTKFGQIRALGHGFKILRGDFDDGHGDGAISHFQALSAALSATVGVGNIGGTALAISMGGPGALFWMWIVGFLGMALKTVEVTVTMLYRKTGEGDNVSGGPMWVVDQGLKEVAPSLGSLAKFLASVFCVTLLIATFTGGLFFQAWNAADITQQFFGIPTWVVGLVLAFIVGTVIIGGIQRIGTVASKIVPFMCAIYMLAAIYAIGVHAAKIPELFQSIFVSAFSSSTANGAFVGGTFGAIFSIGMQRAFFSSEAGQGSSPIAHSAVKTDEPVREGIVAGLEPFIDTIVVCTMTGLVILLSGVWEREPDYDFKKTPEFATLKTEEDHSLWQLSPCEIPSRTDRDWVVADRVFVVVDLQSNGMSQRQQLAGTVVVADGKAKVEWQPLPSETQPKLAENGFYISYDGAALAAVAFNQAGDGLGKWLVTLATWLFGISTMIAWSYYGEQGVTYLFGKNSVLAYRMLFCLIIFLSCIGLAQSRTELTNLSNLGTGVMLWVNIPITLLFAPIAIRHYHAYFSKLNEKSNEQ